MSVSVAGMLQAGKEPVVEAAIVKDIGTIWEQQLPHRVRDLAAFVDADASNHETLEDQFVVRDEGRAKTHHSGRHYGGAPRHHRARAPGCDNLEISAYPLLPWGRGRRIAPGEGKD